MLNARDVIRLCKFCVSEISLVSQAIRCRIVSAPNLRQRVPSASYSYTVFGEVKQKHQQQKSVWYLTNLVPL